MKRGNAESRKLFKSSLSWSKADSRQAVIATLAVQRCMLGFNAGSSVVVHILLSRVESLGKLLSRLFSCDWLIERGTPLILYIKVTSLVRKLYDPKPCDIIGPLMNEVKIFSTKKPMLQE